MEGRAIEVVAMLAFLGVAFAALLIVLGLASLLALAPFLAVYQLWLLSPPWAVVLCVYVAMLIWWARR